MVVRDPTVRMNVLLFLYTLEKAASLHALREKTFSVFIHCRTGEIEFEPKGEQKRDWKHIRLCYDKGAFYVLDDEEKVFRYSDLKPLATRVMEETVKVLNGIAPDMGLRKIRATIEHMSQKPKDVVHEAWHRVDRLGAERLLHREPPGAYLFRKDEYAHLLEEELQKALKKPVQCITLTYLEIPAKVVDVTLVCKEGRWLIYNDNPLLEGKTYHSVDELLETLKHHLMKALVN